MFFTVIPEKSGIQFQVAHNLGNDSKAVRVDVFIPIDFDINQNSKVLENFL